MHVSFSVFDRVYKRELRGQHILVERRGGGYEKSDARASTRAGRRKVLGSAGPAASPLSGTYSTVIFRS